MSDVHFRLAETADLPAVANLRWRWLVEDGDEPAGGRESFRRDFVAWAQAADAHRCVVVVRDSVVIGMAWLAVMARVPTPQELDRAVGDVQSVYIVPEERGGGLGGKLIEGVLALADELGLERVTVHSTTRAVSAYWRAGFTESHRLLQFEPELPPERQPPGH